MQAVVAMSEEEALIQAQKAVDIESFEPNLDLGSELFRDPAVLEYAKRFAFRWKNVHSQDFRNWVVISPEGFPRWPKKYFNQDGTIRNGKMPLCAMKIEINRKAIEKATAPLAAILTKGKAAPATLYKGAQDVPVTVDQKGKDLAAAKASDARVATARLESGKAKSSLPGTE